MFNVNHANVNVVHPGIHAASAWGGLMLTAQWLHTVCLVAVNAIY
jgi:hypothetical protein